MILRKNSSLCCLAALIIATLSTSLVILECNHLAWFFFVPSKELPLLNPGRVVVGVSTFGGRVDFFKESLDSILSQTYVPDRVVISIPLIRQESNVSVSDASTCTDCFDSVGVEHTAEDILKWFTNFFSREPVIMNVSHRIVYQYDHNVVVHFLDKDPGPAAKLLGALMLEERDSSTIIITLDDDITHNKNLVSYLATRTPLHSALSVGCQLCNSFPKLSRQQDELETSTITYENILNMFWWREGKECHGWLLGWAGVAYRPTFFENDIFTMVDKIPMGCFFNDDVWLSGYLKLRGISRTVSPFLPPGPHRRHRRLSLSMVTDTELVNRLPCIQHFGWKPL